MVVSVLLPATTDYYQINFDNTDTVIDNHGMKKELNFQEQAFVSVYVQCFNATQAALESGYSDSVAKHQAYKWVGITSCPPNKWHVRDAVQKRIKEVYGDTLPDSQWVLKRAQLLADFNISSFITTDNYGNAIYDFSDATDDDWYCITEYTVDSISKGHGDDKYDVKRVKIKGHCKLRALELVGKHVDVQAFCEQTDITSGGKPIQNNWHIHPTTTKETPDGRSTAEDS